MGYKDSLLILITFFNTLLLVTGVCSVYASFHYEICEESFCYSIKNFTSFYETTFLYYGLLLSGFCFFGFIALFSNVKALMESYGRLLVFLLVVLIIVFVMGFWGKGSIYLYSSMWTSFKSYGLGSCRLDASINDLQSRFKCCGIASPKDWTLLQNQFKKNITIPPLSCCNSEPYLESLNPLRCRDVYQTGCFTPVHKHTFKFFNTVILIGIFIALDLIMAISGVFRYIELTKSDPESTEIQQIAIDNPIHPPIVPPRPLILSQERFYVKNFQSSTAV